MAADQFMAHKGLRHAQPEVVERVEGAYLWYLEYQLDDGRLVLEVSWRQPVGWSVFVWDFKP